MNRYSDKQRRLQRRRNHIYKDLMNPKYHKRVKEGRKVSDEYTHFNSANWQKQIEEEDD